MSRAPSRGRNSRGACAPGGAQRTASAPLTYSGTHESANAQAHGHADERAVEDCKAQSNSDGGAYKAANP